MRRLTKTKRRLILLGAAAAVIGVLGYQWRAAIKRNRSVPDEPFQIADNLYYVGATGVAAFLLTGSDGHVLIDGGHPVRRAESYADAEKRFREVLAEQQKRR